MAELKPCPFCGGEAKLHSSFEFSYVSCRKCGIQTPVRLSDVEACNKWNKRSNWHTDTPTEDGLYILHCSNGIDDYHFNQLRNGNWRFHWLGKLIAWQKITPFEEGEEVNG